MKALFFGLGGIGQRHLRNLRAKYGNTLEVAAYRVRNLTQTVSPTLAIEEGVNVNAKYDVRVYHDLDEALAFGAKIAFITNPSSLHIPVALKAAEHGCHLFMEKPLSHNLDGVDELITLCRRKNLAGLVGYQLRYHPCLKKVKALLDEGAIGRVLSVHAEVGEYLPGWHKYEDYRQMYASREDLGGGVILSQIHELDYLYSWFGMPRKLAALGGHVSSLEIDTEDTAKIIMEHDYQGRSLPVSLHMDFNQRPPSRGCKVVGEDGKVLMSLADSTVVHQRNDGTEESFDFSQLERNQLFTDQLDHFIRCVEGEDDPLVSLEDGANSLRMALMAKESLATGRMIEYDQAVAGADKNG